MSIPALDEAISNVVLGPSHVATRTKASSIERARVEKWLADLIAKGRGATSVYTITQVVAELLLERNTKNRPLALSNLTALHKDVTSSRWKYNGESIVVSDTGVLLDGQHRLMMVLKSGIPIESTISFGVPDDARDTIDIGKTRSAADLLWIDFGIEDAVAVATVVSYIIQWQSLRRLAQASAERPTKTQVKKALQELAGVTDSVAFVKGLKAVGKVASLPVLAFCHWAFTQRTDRERADAFMVKLITGVGTKEGNDPIQYVRQRLTNTKEARAPERSSLIFKAWNLWRTGQPFGVIQKTKFLPIVEG